MLENQDQTHKLHYYGVLHMDTPVLADQQELTLTVMQSRGDLLGN